MKLNQEELAMIQYKGGDGSSKEKAFIILGPKQ